MGQVILALIFGVLILAMLPAMFQAFQQVELQTIQVGGEPDQELSFVEEETLSVSPIGAPTPVQTSAVDELDQVVARLNIDESAVIAEYDGKRFAGAHFLAMVRYLEFLRGGELTESDADWLQEYIQASFEGDPDGLFSLIAWYQTVLDTVATYDPVRAMRDREDRRARFFCALDTLEQADAKKFEDIIFSNRNRIEISSCRGREPFVVTERSLVAIAASHDLIAELADQITSDGATYADLRQYYREAEVSAIGEVEREYLHHAQSRALALRNYWQEIGELRYEDARLVVQGRVVTGESIPVIARDAEDVVIEALEQARKNALSEGAIPPPNEVVYRQLTVERVFGKSE